MFGQGRNQGLEPIKEGLGHAVSFFVYEMIGKCFFREHDFPDRNRIGSIA